MAKIIDDETMENVCILAKLSLSGQEREVVRIHQQQQKPHGSGNCGTE